jgi:hypothetical protein
MSPHIALRGVLKFLGVVLAAGVVGVGVGVALAELSGGDDDGTSLAPQATRSTPLAATARAPAGPATPATAPSTPPATPVTSTLPATGAAHGRTNRVRILSAVLYPAATAGGQARRRARIVVRVRVTNRGAAALAPQDALLLAGDRRVAADPRASTVARSLRRPLAAGARATGELRFETAGAVTRLLTTKRRALLRMAGRTVAMAITIGRTPPITGRAPQPQQPPPPQPPPPQPQPPQQSPPPPPPPPPPPQAQPQWQPSPQPKPSPKPQQQP